MQIGNVNQGEGGEFVNPISNRAKTVLRAWIETSDHAKKKGVSGTAKKTQFKEASSTQVWSRKCR